jgi:hypothetical protein
MPCGGVREKISRHSAGAFLMSQYLLVTSSTSILTLELLYITPLHSAMSIGRKHIPFFNRSLINSCMFSLVVLFCYFMSMMRCKITIGMLNLVQWQHKTSIIYSLYLKIYICWFNMKNIEDRKKKHEKYWRTNIWLERALFLGNWHQSCYTYIFRITVLLLQLLSIFAFSVQESCHCQWNIRLTIPHVIMHTNIHKYLYVVLVLAYGKKCWLGKKT